VIYGYNRPHRSGNVGDSPFRECRDRSGSDLKVCSPAAVCPSSQFFVNIKIPTRNPGMKEVPALTQTYRDGKINHRIESVQGKRKTAEKKIHSRSSWYAMNSSLNVDD
jgi:hypothetical protein